MSTRMNSTQLVIGGAVVGAVIYAGVQQLWTTVQSSKKKNPETAHELTHAIVWNAIGGALSAAQLYVGDRLDLYSTLRECCGDVSSVTAIELAERTGYSQRWLREWLAQQAALGILQLLPGSGNDDASLRYRIPKATAEVLADPSSKEYDIAMVSLVPSLVHRAKTMLPEAFQTGIGRPYDDADISSAIDRQHAVHIRDKFLPLVVQKVLGGSVHRRLEEGCTVADLGCGAGNLLRAMAQAYPNSTFHGFEVSQQALTVGAQKIAQTKMTNVFLHDGNDDPLGGHKFDLVTTFDVLHDAPNPSALIQQVRQALTSPSGVWLLADIPARPTIRENIAAPMASTSFAFSTCLCMSCSLSTPDGAGLGTLGFTVPVANRMLLDEGGFDKADVVFEDDNTRWFAVV